MNHFKSRKGNANIWFLLILVVIFQVFAQLLFIGSAIHDRHIVDSALESAAIAAASNVQVMFSGETGEETEVLDEIKAENEAHDLFWENIQLNGKEEQIKQSKNAWKTSKDTDKKKFTCENIVAIKLVKILPFIPESINYKCNASADSR